MSIRELLFYTAQFNICHKWRFSFGRKCSKKRIEKLSFAKNYDENNKYNRKLEQVKKELLKKIEYIGYAQ